MMFAMKRYNCIKTSIELMNSNNAQQSHLRTLKEKTERGIIREGEV